MPGQAAPGQSGPTAGSLQSWRAHLHGAELDLAQKHSAA